MQEPKPEPKPEVEPEWMSYRDSEILSGLSRVTLWRAAKRGQLRIAYVGRAARISRKSLTDFMEAHVPDRTTS